jgi:hypothetical protein
LANKRDEDAAVYNIAKFIDETGVTPLQVSALDPEHPGIDQFKQRLWDLLRPEPRGSWGASEAETKGVPADEAASNDGEIIPEEMLKSAPFLDLTRKKPKKRK